MTRIPLIALFVLAVLFLAACGGGGGGTTASPSAVSTADATAAKAPVKRAGPSGNEAGTQPGGQSSDAPQARGNDRSQGAGSSGAPGDTSASFTPTAHQDSPTGAAPFEAKGGDNSIQEFGSEAPGADFAAAATALHGYLDARAAGAWSAACSYMSPGIAASPAQLGGGSGRGASCPEALASLLAGVSSAALEEGAEADVGAMRTEGAQAFLLFHGAHGTDFFIPMASEGGAWKVAAIAPSAIP